MSLYTVHFECVDFFLLYVIVLRLTFLFQKEIIKSVYNIYLFIYIQALRGEPQWVLRFQRVSWELFAARDMALKTSLCF